MRDIWSELRHLNSVKANELTVENSTSSILAAISGISGGGGGAFYVSSDSGSGHGTGTITDPFKYILEAMNGTHSGDVLVLMDTVNLNSSQASVELQYRTVKGPGGITIQSGADELVLHDVSFDGVKITGSYNKDMRVYSDVIFKNCVLRGYLHIGNHSVAAQGHFTFDSCIYITRPSPPTMEICYTSDTTAGIDVLITANDSWLPGVNVNQSGFALNWNIHSGYFFGFLHNFCSGDRGIIKQSTFNDSSCDFHSATNLVVDGCVFQVAPSNLPPYSINNEQWAKNSTVALDATVAKATAIGTPADLGSGANIAANLVDIDTAIASITPTDLTPVTDRINRIFNDKEIPELLTSLLANVNYIRNKVTPLPVDPASNTGKDNQTQILRNEIDNMQSRLARILDEMRKEAAKVPATTKDGGKKNVL